MNKKMCILVENKTCDECGQCLMCDLDPKKICDNCCRCIEIGNHSDYKSIEISEIILDEADSDAAPDEPITTENKHRQYRFRIIKKDG